MRLQYPPSNWSQDKVEAANALGDTLEFLQLFHMARVQFFPGNAAAQQAETDLVGITTTLLQRFLTA